MSTELASPVLVALNYDDDVLMYWLFVNGSLVDQYDSCPGHLEGEENDPTGGDPIELCTAFATRSNMKKVADLLRSTSIDWAYQRHLALCALLNIPGDLALLSFESIVHDALPAGLSHDQLIHVQ